jgi:PAS domain S-box-containing protein
MANSLKNSDRELRDELEKLKKSESMYRLLAENTSDLIRYQLPSGKFNYVSPNIEEYTGYTAEEYYSFEPLQNVFTEDHKILQDAVEKFKDGASELKIEYRIYHKSGKIVWLESRIRAIRNENGEFISLVSSSNDITRKKESEHKLKESEIRYKQLVETAVDAIYLINEKGIIIDTNHQATLMLEKSKDEIIGQSVGIIDPNFSVDAFLEYWRDFPYDTQRTFETTHTDKAGNIIPIEINGKKFLIDGETYYYGIARNISERKIAISKIEASEKKLKSYIDNAPDGVFVVNEKGQYLDANPASTRMTGYSYEELLQMSIPDLLQKDEVYKGIDHFNEVKEKGFAEGEIGFVTKSGENRFWHVAAVKLSDNRFMGFVKDVTEAKRAFDTVNVFFDQPINIHLIGNIDGEILKVNKGWEETLGYSKDESLGKSIFDFIHPEDKEITLQELAELEKGKTTFYFENRYRHKDGNYLLLAWSAIFNAYAEELHGVAKDITKQRAYSEKLEKRYRELVDTVNSGVAIYKVINDGESGSDYIIQDFNQFALSHEKMRREDVIGKSLKDIRPNIDDFGLIDVFRKVWQTGESKFFPAKVYVDEKYSNYYENRVFRLPSKEIVAIYDDVTERESAIIKLAENEAKLKSIIDNSTNLFFTHTTDHKLTFISPQVKEYLGYEPDEILDDWTKFISDNPMNEQAVKSTNRAIKTGERQPPYEVEMVHKDGKKILMEVREAPVLKNGKVISIVGSLADITDRKRAEQQIIAQNEEYEALNEELQQTNSQLSATIAREEEINDRYNKAMLASSDGIFDWDLITNEIYYSPSWKSMLGYKENELPNDFSIWETLTDQEDVKRSWNMLNSLIDGKINKFDMEFKMKHKGGHWVEIHSRADVFRNEKGEAVRVVGTHTDISERKKADALLRKSEQNLQLSDLRYRKAEEIGKVGNWEYNVVTEQFWASDQSKRIYGFDVDIESFSTEQVENCIPERERVHQALVDLIEEDKPYNLEFDIITNDKGVRKTITSVAELIKDENGVPQKIIGVIQDVTERVQLINELKKAKEKAEESDRLKSAFLANMSHEIRTPMNGILGFADLLKKPGLNSDSHQKYIKIIEESGARMLNIINDIIDISKIEAGLMELNLKATNVNEQIEYIYTFFKPELESKGLKFNFVTPLTAKEATIISDSEKLYAILVNLIKNAIKYTNKGFIELGYEQKIIDSGNLEADYRKMLQFYVKDSGIGIAKERQAAVFERFIQADIEDKMAHQGAGLGLAITKNYVEKLGGKIWVESEKNVGSAFYFTLPYNTNPKSELYVTSRETDSGNSVISKLKILIAEDDEVSEMLLDETLSQFSNETLKAKTGLEAVKICRKYDDIDLVLMDLRMPEMGGFDAVKEIRSFNKNVVIIAQTAYGLEGDRERSLLAGCNDYIPKPIKKSELYELINKYFGAR